MYQPELLEQPTLHLLSPEYLAMRGQRAAARQAAADVESLLDQMFEATPPEV